MDSTERLALMRQRNRRRFKRVLGCGVLALLAGIPLAVSGDSRTQSFVVFGLGCLLILGAFYLRWVTNWLSAKVEQGRDRRQESS
jgi:peptidoglycan/LPS O-acetylase OafA/YrhL